MNWHEECRRVHRLGVEAREKMPYKDAGIPFLLIPYSKDGSHAPPLMFPQGINDIGRAFLKRSVIDVFRAGKITAAVLQSDTRMADMRKFIHYFKLPESLTPEQASDEYVRILGDQFGGTMENLPGEIWYDSIMTTIKGPAVSALLINSTYHGNEKNRVVWDKSSETTGVIAPMLPDWWDSRVN